MLGRSGVEAIAIGMLLLTTGRGQDPASSDLKAVLENPAIAADDRARRALEAAAELDATAQRTARIADRLAGWDEALALLDGFLARNPTIETAPLLRFQAGVYAWARGRTLLDQAEFAPGEPAHRAGAIAALDDSVSRLRALPLKPDDSADPFGQNARFRLAQAIADRARLDPEGSPARLAAEREGRALLERPMALPELRGFAHLLRSELANRLGLLGQAQIEIEEAERSVPPPPAPALLEVKVGALAGRSLFEDARKLVAGSRVDEGLKGLLSLRIALATRREMNSGPPRDAVDGQAFAIADGIRKANRPETRKALIELARTIDEPAASAPEASWDLLSEGQLRLGNPGRAGRIAAKGGDRLEAQGQASAAARLRSKAGACLFEAEHYADADRVLTRIVDSPAIAAEARARAGMLRALARGRALALGQPGASRESYLAALEGQVRDFPAEQATGEGRWLLGKVRQSSGRRDEAIALWSGIPHGHPRWLEAALTVADLLRQAVEDQRISREQSTTRARMDEARRSLRAAVGAATEGAEPAALGLRLARLELIPGAGDPARALEAADRVLAGPAQPDQHRQARFDRMVALAELSRFVEAEQVARLEAKAGDLGPALPALKVLDHAAADTESELLRRKIGLVLRVLTARLVERLDDLTPRARDEGRLRHARALLFSGEAPAARREIVAWGGPGALDDTDLLRDLADAYLRLDAFALAIDVERIRAGKLAPGSLPWLEARYGLALALFRSHRAKEAGQIVDATAILHPELGGGDLKVKFVRLQQRIAQE